MAVRISGSGQSYTQSTPTFGTLSQFTVSCWFRKVASTNDWTSLWELSANTGNVVQFASEATGNTFKMADSANITADIIEPVNGTWYWLGVTWSGTSGTWRIKPLGGSVTPGSWSNLSQTTVSATTLHLARSVFTDNNNEWFNGNLAAFKLWTGVNLTAAELDQESTQTKAIRTTNLTAFYPFPQAEVTDYSGNGRSLSGGSGATTEDGPGIPWSTGRARVFIPLASGTDHEVNINDTLALSDTLGRTASYIRTISDVETLSDTLAKSATLNFSDALDLSDSLDSNTILQVNLADTLSLSDALTRQMDYDRTISDTEALSDALGRVVDYQRDVSDTLTLSDTMTPDHTQGIITVNLFDTLTLSDSLDPRVNVHLTVGELERKWSLDTGPLSTEVGRLEKKWSFRTD